METKKKLEICDFCNARRHTTTDTKSLKLTLVLDSRQLVGVVFSSLDCSAFRLSGISANIQPTTQAQSQVRLRQLRQETRTFYDCHHFFKNNHYCALGIVGFLASTCTTFLWITSLMNNSSLQHCLTLISVSTEPLQDLNQNGAPVNQLSTTQTSLSETLIQERLR